MLYENVAKNVKVMLSAARTIPASTLVMGRVWRPGTDLIATPNISRTSRSLQFGAASPLHIKQVMRSSRRASSPHPHQGRRERSSKENHTGTHRLQWLDWASNRISVHNTVVEINNSYSCFLIATVQITLDWQLFLANKLNCIMCPSKSLMLTWDWIISTEVNFWIHLQQSELHVYTIPLHTLMICKIAHWQRKSGDGKRISLKRWLIFFISLYKAMCWVCCQLR